MKILVIDNYDSFTYNLVHSLKKYANDITVVRNDGISLEEVNLYDKILLSPGPGIPDEANFLKPIIEKYAPTKSIFGVCLGQQAIGEVFGGTLLNTQEVFHGVKSDIEIIKDEILFKNLPQNLEVGRYHSWVVSNENFPEELEITAVGPKGEIMALRHKIYDVRGVQFHPESILTPFGDKMIKNWLEA
ncbi:anthranilate synthase component II [Empedobacter brevis]|uniref:anthranilate synthase component II n=1 Tax=Empedobacter brevis TaxID=247 RepID=UPI00289B6EFE|nr:aminodeoxychorismate/anthranilate synthase component II [Empedobacter brevis]